MLKIAQRTRGGIARLGAVARGRRWISGCSANDYLKWQELETAQAAAMGTSKEVDGASETVSNTRPEGGAPVGVGLRPAVSQSSPRDASGEVPAAARTGQALNADLQVSESLARQLKRAQARWKAAQGRRQMSTRALDHRVDAALDGTGDRNIAGWRKDAREIAPKCVGR